MRKYVTRSYWDSGENFRMLSYQTITVVEQESGPVKTGLFDSRGNELYRVEEKEPVGYRPGKSDG